MSYASVAASGPEQSEEEHTDDEVHSLIDVDSPHISSVPSDFESQEIKTETQQREHELEAEAREQEEKLKQEAERAKEQAKKLAAKADKNKENPVVLSNAIGITVLGGLLGYGAYRKYSVGELTWKVAGAWAGVVGLFAVADFYTSQYFFKKYPTKK
ncbi:hypothetical protein AAFC00_002215 [Neodothiora populina]|uniref:Mitochondrial outer membrane protein OM14 C-terminal domain-containing protein n=1 Tax=Neodothiora populina TaxID=2781224 RepID=A0ABR3PGM8_9PEZI